MKKIVLFLLFITQSSQGNGVWHKELTQAFDNLFTSRQITFDVKKLDKEIRKRKMSYCEKLQEDAYCLVATHVELYAKNPIESEQFLKTMTSLKDFYQLLESIKLSISNRYSYTISPHAFKFYALLRLL